MANRLKIYLRNTLRELSAIPLDKLIEARYEKFRRMGIFLEGVNDSQPTGAQQAVNPPHRQVETASPETNIL